MSPRSMPTMWQSLAGSRVAPRPRSITPETVALAQGAYFAATGAWPIVHMPSFEAVTGPKVDRWLVRTVGAMITVVGATLLQAGRKGRVTPEVRMLAAGSAAALAAVDCVYVARGRIPPIYLLDAVAEVGLLTAWSLAGPAQGGSTPGNGST